MCCSAAPSPRGCSRRVHTCTAARGWAAHGQCTGRAGVSGRVPAAQPSVQAVPLPGTRRGARAAGGDAGGGAGGGAGREVLLHCGGAYRRASASASGSSSSSQPPLGRRAPTPIPAGSPRAAAAARMGLGGALLPPCNGGGGTSSSTCAPRAPTGRIAPTPLATRPRAAPTRLPAQRGGVHRAASGDKGQSRRELRSSPKSTPGGPGRSHPAAGGDAWAAAKRLQWGDALPPEHELPHCCGGGPQGDAGNQGLSRMDGG